MQQDQDKSKNELPEYKQACLNKSNGSCCQPLFNNQCDNSITMTNTIDQQPIAHSKDNGTSTSTASAQIVNNIIVIPSYLEINDSGAAYKLDIDGEIIDIQIDKDANVYVNGKKGNQDQPTVFVFKHEEIKTSETDSQI